MSKGWGNGDHAEKLQREHDAKQITDLTIEMSDRLTEHGPIVMQGVLANLVSIWLTGITHHGGDPHIFWHNRLRGFNNVVIKLTERHYHEIKKFIEEGDDDD